MHADAVGNGSAGSLLSGVDDDGSVDTSMHDEAFLEQSIVSSKETVDQDSVFEYKMQLASTDANDIEGIDALPVHMISLPPNNGNGFRRNYVSACTE